MRVARADIRWSRQGHATAHRCPPMNIQQHSDPVILFAWNPKRMESGEYRWRGFSRPHAHLREVRTPGGVGDFWNIGRRKLVPTGAIALLVRTGRDNPGVVLSGVVEDGVVRREDSSGRYVKLRWTAGINWVDDPALALSSAFGARAARRVGYCLQQSGHALNGEDAVRLLKAWTRHASYYSGRTIRCAGLDGTAAAFRANEGTAWRERVLKRERSKAVRRQLLRQGTRCASCDLDPSTRFGDHESRVLEVHHLEAIAQGPRTTLLDDVCLLCRNCHALAHIRNPPISIAGIKRRVRR